MRSSTTTPLSRSSSERRYERTLIITDYAWPLTDRCQDWRQDTEKKPTDVVSWLLKAKDDGDPSAPASDRYLYDEGRLAIVAGRSVDVLILSA
jgi:cytochrome P450